MPQMWLQPWMRLLHCNYPMYGLNLILLLDTSVPLLLARPWILILVLGWIMCAYVQLNATKCSKLLADKRRAEKVGHNSNIGIIERIISRIHAWFLIMETATYTKIMSVTQEVLSSSLLNLEPFIHSAGLLLRQMTQIKKKK